MDWRLREGGRCAVVEMEVSFQVDKLIYEEEGRDGRKK